MSKDVNNVTEGNSKRHFSGEREILKLMFAFTHTSYAGFITYQDVYLAILTGKSYVLLNSIQRMTGWLLLIFFVCLHNQLSSKHSIISIKSTNV